MKKILFPFIAGVGVSVQIFTLGPCEIAKLHICGHTHSIILYNLS